ncbi:unnamed protein product [Amoebophrya sp. A25]|nr:unnamed protein product [Amoebophrya sp. A25]|eukprot:GSA25T00017248001.1
MADADDDDGTVATSAQDFPAITAMTLGLITYIWFLSMTSGKLDDGTYDKLGPAILGKYGGGCRQMSYDLYFSEIAHGFATPNSAVYAVNAVALIFFMLWIEFAYQAKATCFLLGIWWLLMVLQAVVMDVIAGNKGNVKIPSGGLGLFVLQMAIWLPWQRFFEIRAVLYPPLTREEKRAQEIQDISAEAQKLGVTYEMLYAMGLPQEGIVQADANRRKTKLEEYRIMNRKTGGVLSERDRFLQRCPYPNTYIVCLVTGVPLVALAAQYLILDGISVQMNIVPVLVVGVFGAIFGLCLFMIPWVRRKGFRHMPLKRTILDLQDDSDDDDLGHQMNTLMTAKGTEAGDDQEAPDIGGEWNANEQLFHRYNHNFMCKLAYCCFTLGIATYVTIAQRAQIGARFH